MTLLVSETDPEQLRFLDELVILLHDLDLLANADYIIDMGPSGGVNGGEIVAEGTLDDIIKNSRSRTAQYLKDIK